MMHMSIRVYAGSLEVGKLKLLCQRLFKVPAARQALFLRAGGENPMPDNIGEDDSKDLTFFSVEVGHARLTGAGAASSAHCLCIVPRLLCMVHAWCMSLLAFKSVNQPVVCCSAVAPTLW